MIQLYDDCISLETWRVMLGEFKRAHRGHHWIGSVRDINTIIPVFDDKGSAKLHCDLECIDCDTALSKTFYKYSIPERTSPQIAQSETAIPNKDGQG